MLLHSFGDRYPWEQGASPGLWQIPRFSRLLCLDERRQVRIEQVLPEMLSSACDGHGLCSVLAVAVAWVR